ncbi:hypothetical protein RIF29_18820 [Crotalaria pallida]|uniref:Uncharacterized protein n=1 Tax=Crotalaria pallida TaxID=3830 RepID=A0AAN9F6M6_CROPI
MGYDQATPNAVSIFDRIWSWKGPERIRSLLWKIGNAPKYPNFLSKSRIALSLSLSLLFSLFLSLHLLSHHRVLFAQNLCDFSLFPAPNPSPPMIIKP